MGNKIIIWIVVVVILIIGGWYLLRQRVEQILSPQETVTEEMASRDGWKKYINEFDGFSIEYPPDWYTVVYQLGDLEIPASIEIWSPSTTGKAQEGNRLVITASPFEGTLKEVLPAPLPPEYKKLITVTVDDIIFRGEEAIRINSNISPTTEAPQGSKSTRISVKRNQKLYNLSYVYSGATEKESLGVFKTMLGTFKFGDASIEKFSLSKSEGIKHRARTIARSLDLYFHDKGSYPKTEEDLKILEEAGYQSWDIPLLFPDSFYEYTSNGQTYEISVSLVNELDPQCVMEGSLCIYRIKDGRVVSNK